jgi:predicted MFS family arabinose efflux permease
MFVGARNGGALIRRIGVDAALIGVLALLILAGATFYHHASSMPPSTAATQVHIAVNMCDRSGNRNALHTR